MPFLLDVTVVLGFGGDGSGAIGFPPGTDEEEECFLSTVTAAELLESALGAREPERRACRLAYVEALLDQFPLVPVDRRVARMHAQLRAGWLPKGLRPHDVWLAATGLAYGLTLATARPGEFAGVPGLRAVEWSRNEG